MSQFKYYHYAKIITWERTDFAIEATTQEEADQIARRFTGYDVDETDGVILGETQIDFNANMPISVADNDGLPTVEVYNSGEGRLLATNITPVLNN